MSAVPRLLAIVALASASPAVGQDGARLFVEKIAPVLEHPRCVNCHPRGDFPRQGDERRRHDLGVVRGPHDDGAVGSPCSTCHQRANQPASGVPGARHWRLAPRSMGWAGLSKAELCRALKDRKLNGNRDLARLVEHMSEDPLVLWAWAPGGGRTPVSIPQPEFVAALTQWAELGGPCPP